MLLTRFAGLMHSTLCTVIVVNHCKEAKLVSFMYFEGLEHVHVHVYYVAMVMAGGIIFACTCTCTPLYGIHRMRYSIL